jgi:glycosyltransferase involved in cell wall biosynthesis
MRVASLSHATSSVADPDAWVSRLSFFTGILTGLARFADVASFHCIARNAVLNREGVIYFFLRLLSGERWLPFRLHRRVRKWEPDVVIVQGLIFPWQVILLRLQLGRNTKILVQHHKEKPGRSWRKIIQRAADRCVDAYLFTCAEQAEPWLKKRIIVHPGKVEQLFEGSSEFRPSSRDEARKRTAVGPGMVYLWVGRLISIKDPLTVVSAFIRFLKGGHKGDLYMIFQTTDLLDEIKVLLKDHSDVAPFVHLVGRVDHNELVHWYNSADFFVLGSYDEATNISLCEAMSCGCVPIVTDIPAFRAMTGYGKCGLLFPPGDQERLLDTLVNSTRLELASEKQKVLDQFQNELSFDAIAGKLIKILS